MLCKSFRMLQMTDTLNNLTSEYNIGCTYSTFNIKLNTYIRQTYTVHSTSDKPHRAKIVM